MKKIVSIALIISAAYLAAYFFVGKHKGYPILPQKNSNMQFRSLSLFNKEEQSMEYLKKARQYASDSLFYSAIEYAYKAYKKDHRNYEALFLAGKFSMMEENYYNAIDYFQKLIDKTDYKIDSVYYLKGLAEYKSEEYEDAISDLKNAINKNDSLVNAYYYLACTYYDMDDYDRAWLYGKSAHEIKPDEIFYFSEYAYFTLEKALNTDSTYLSKALSLHRQVLEKAPDDKYTLINLSYIYTLLNKWDSAAYYAEIAKQKYPDYYSPYNQLARIYFEQKKYKKVLENAEIAIKLDTSNDDIYLIVARTYKATDSCEKASEYYYDYFLKTKEAINLYYAAQCAEVQNDTLKAVDYYSLYLTNVTQTDTLYQKVLKKIADMTPY